jgi:hypothetical protein
METFVGIAIFAVIFLWLSHNKGESDPGWLHRLLSIKALPMAAEGGGAFLPLSRRERITVFWIALLNLPPLLGILAWPIAVFLSLFLFDAPGSQYSPLTALLNFAVLSYPFLTLLGASMTATNCRNRRFMRCAASTLITYSGMLAVGFFSRDRSNLPGTIRMRLGASVDAVLGTPLPVLFLSITPNMNQPRALWSPDAAR